MGITADFDSAVPASNAGPRAQLSVPRPCRLCGGPSWLADELGAVHNCCLLHGGDCLACRASEQLNREQRRRKPRPWKEVKGEGVDG